ncbi:MULTISPECIES: DUF421 domain-containing protein [Caproicibacterium]|jgi:uncharacterized membrane protein YcaP (DUF421 family)|uniref:DUF421 domain-containing protein n=1 Tax=Caproicibacterium lactatifermentans TaxID=2666138 RepID=A0A859DQJ4_9FIRM|nr:DUF421 domain-containing protein [Caproicibacterium lactatifermentans]ARP50555.1 hypothetical protein B6259_06490 [Ruminococcaceae bacterium CPB6]MDD4808332.1 DUF421 domain-containing protein [Oscillospiraceae bacterium]QKN23725.1 DUF421 domain-containing protein [Caproicibacterium lactatifermentans]QKO29639.1 DUF421 domain-containing protein [Caproicibacterium lactatifermentans]
MTISFIRTLLLYILIIAAVRLMGKRQISELQTSELVVTLLISNIAAIPMQDSGQPLVSGVLPIMVLVVCELFTSWSMMKSGKFRKLICGKPIVIIDDGTVQQSEMRKLRLTTEDLFEQLREKNVFSLKDVAYAIVETDGRISIIKKPDKEQPTAGMLGIAVPNPSIETVVVSDGVVSNTSLQVCGKSEKWLEETLRHQNVRAEDIFIMTANTKGDYQIIPKEKCV